MSEKIKLNNIDLFDNTNSLDPITTSQAVNLSDTFEILYRLSFYSPNQVFVFSIESDGEGVIEIDTRDCCIPGDHWGIRVIDNCEVVAEMCGDGNTSTFSGLVTLENLKSAIVEVFYCSGVDIFAAGMTVRFRYTGEEFSVNHVGTCHDQNKSCNPFISLMIDINTLVQSGVLNEGQSNSLIVKIKGACKSLKKGNLNSAINKLNAFINEINGLMNGGILTPVQGQSLIAAAQDIIDDISES